MKFTLSWLNQFVSTDSLPASQLADKLTISASRIADLRSAINFLAPVVESTPESSAVELGKVHSADETSGQDTADGNADEDAQA